MSKEFTVSIQAGCRIASAVSDAAKKKNTVELFDVLEIMPDGRFRCHMPGTRFDRKNRSVFIHEHELVWCRQLDGREFARSSPEERWQDARQPA